MHRCAAPSNSAACVLEWLNVTIHDEMRVLIDPWIPIGITEDELIRDKNNNYSNTVESGRVWWASNNVVAKFNQLQHPLRDMKGWETDLWEEEIHQLRRDNGFRM